MGLRLASGSQHCIIKLYSAIEQGVLFTGSLCPQKTAFWISSGRFPAQGLSPWDIISHIRTPKDHTSLADENFPQSKTSGDNQGSISIHN